MKKRLVSLLVISMLCVSLAGCGHKAKDEEFVVDEGKLKQTETVAEVAEEAPVEEPTETESTDEAEDGDIYTVALSDVGPNTVKVIKAVRELTGMGLKESKDLVDSVVDGPVVIAENISEEEALEMKGALEAEEAVVTVSEVGSGSAEIADGIWEGFMLEPGKDMIGKEDESGNPYTIIYKGGFEGDDFVVYGSMGYRGDYSEDQEYISDENPHTFKTTEESSYCALDGSKISRDEFEALFNDGLSENYLLGVIVKEGIATNFFISEVNFAPDLDL